MTQAMDVAQPPRPAAPNPWLAMWTRPRETVRFLVADDRTYMVLILAALMGVGQVLDNASLRDLGLGNVMLPVVLVLVIIAALVVAAILIPALGG